MSYKRIWSVITDCGDGSNNIEWVTDPKVLEKMEQLADDGNEAYASGDGLQVREFKFPADFDLDAWIELNYIDVTTLEELLESYDLDPSDEDIEIDLEDQDSIFDS